MQLSADEKAKIKGNKKSIINLKEGYFFIKKLIPDVDFEEPISFATSELIGVKIAELLNLKHPKYYIYMPDASHEEEIYMLSEDINSLGVFQTAEEMGINDYMNYSLYEIWFQLEKDFKNRPNLFAKIPELFHDIIKMYIFDIFFANTDRTNNNYGFVFHDDTVDLVVYDNEFILNSITDIILSPAFNGTSRENNLNKVDGLRTNIEMFYHDSSEEFITMFEYYLQLFTPTFFRNLLEIMEKEETIITDNGIIPLEIDSKEDIIDIYTANYKRIEEIWKGLKHGRK